jgi:hypothetical protein
VAHHSLLASAWPDQNGPPNRCEVHPKIGDSANGAPMAVLAAARRLQLASGEEARSTMAVATDR